MSAQDVRTPSYRDPGAILDAFGRRALQTFSYFQAKPVQTMRTGFMALRAAQSPLRRQDKDVKKIVKLLSTLDTAHKVVRHLSPAMIDDAIERLNAELVFSFNSSLKHQPDDMNFDDPTDLGCDFRPAPADEAAGAVLFDIFSKEDFVCQATQTDDSFSSNAFTTVLAPSDILAATAAQSIYQVSSAFAQLNVAMEAVASFPELTVGNAEDEAKSEMIEAYFKVEPTNEEKDLADDIAAVTKALSRFADAYALLYNFEEDFNHVGMCANDILHYDLSLDDEEFGLDCNDSLLIGALSKDLGLSDLRDWARIRACDHEADMSTKDILATT